jgi:hypothetical protein
MHDTTGIYDLGGRFSGATPIPLYWLCRDPVAHGSRVP